jgi:gamma-glutamylcyclotransferase (GGCT)/AIG2-like uncharacterized protein YtfP
MRFFFYGTLMDPEVLGHVLGRKVAAPLLAKALLPGYRRYALARDTYPVAVRVPGGLVEGLTLDGVEAEEAERLAYYESAAYTILAETVMIGSERKRAILFAAERASFDLSADGWSLAIWQRQHKQDFMPRVLGAMKRFRSPKGLRNWPTTD